MAARSCKGRSVMNEPAPLPSAAPTATGSGNWLKGGVKYWFALMVGVVSLLLTVGVWQWLVIEQGRSTETEFTLEAEQRAEGIKRQFFSETSVIRALLGYYQASEDVGPDEFKAFETTAYAKGFSLVSSTPLTRSSHHAGEDFAKLKAARLTKLG